MPPPSLDASCPAYAAVLWPNVRNGSGSGNKVTLHLFAGQFPDGSLLQCCSMTAPWSAVLLPDLPAGLDGLDGRVAVLL